MSKSFPLQQKWFDLIKHHFNGDEKAAKKYVSQRLREAADVVENDGFPSIFGCDVPTPDQNILRDSFISGITIVLSDVWPG